MLNIIVSFVLGFSFAFLLRLIVIDRREKRGLHEIKYRPLSLSSKMKIMVREIIFKFSIRKYNSDFLLNIKSNEVYLMQVMHRAHFPEVCENISDVKFGLAIYIPTKSLTLEEKKKLDSVLKEESEGFIKAEYPVEFLVIDAGSRVRYTGYLLARITKEVFKKEDVSFQLYDEGILPYHYSSETGIYIPNQGSLN